ncbi:PilZ domain-containing protein [Wukongibacter baidiensis]|uniref:PilZ domain-containing protein n=1 Tax=Wukongibacter baidiensis TaxID=1723361 RepID=UPI003D7F8B4A
MEDKRKSKRLPVNINLEIESLYQSGDKTFDDINDKVTLINVSKTGIGLISDIELPIGYYFNAKITIDEEKMFYSVLRIVRNQKINSGFMVGCEFVGLADVLSDSIDDYEKEIFE